MRGHLITGIAVALFLAPVAYAVPVTEDWTGTDDDPWPSQWDVTANGQNVTIQNNQGEMRWDTSGGPSTAMLNSATYTDSVQEVDVSMSSTNGMELGIIARSDGTSYYLGRIDDGKYGGSYGEWAMDILKVEPAGETELAHDELLDQAHPPEFGHLEFSVQGGDLILTYTGPNAITNSISVNDPTPLTGNQVGLYVMSNVSSGRYILFDNYSADVPEPATLGLLALGGLAVLLRRRRA